MLEQLLKDLIVVKPVLDELEQEELNKLFRLLLVAKRNNLNQTEAILTPLFQQLTLQEKEKILSSSTSYNFWTKMLRRAKSSEDIEDPSS